ncbi:J domain-containing protein [Algihabitans albus]|uniref:J domain-containing protein n=1 Tax=Algihabitans albus TaxID=2164067 RepID=UPI000E5D6118|nr:J domain-containing protein [Algihabitans albus]
MEPSTPTQPRTSEDATGASATGRICDHPACAETGLHRAPRDRNQPGAFYWFCLEHVRAYNLSWDWFAGMSEMEIEAQRRRDQIWDRPTWSFAGSDQVEDCQDPFDLFAEEREASRRRRAERRRRARSEEELALAELDLSAPATLAEVKIRYKFLAKRLHPDANGGDPAAEDRLKSVNRAYATLKTLYAPKVRG